MKIRDYSFERLFTFKKNRRLGCRYDVELTHSADLKRFSAFESHLVLYPYSRKICSSNFFFNPFEEYVRDIQSAQRSAYYPYKSEFGKIFGFILGIIIAFLFYINNSGVVAAESIISLIGAYFIGKELWDDIESFFINLTKRWPLRYQQDYYKYKLENNTTLTNYSTIAKKNRYGKLSALPGKIDFIAQSNSETLRMHFSRQDLRRVTNGSLHLLSIKVDKNKIEDFERHGYMLGIKAAFTRRFLFINSKVELFQSLNRKKIGCLDCKGNWRKGAIFYRRLLTVGRLRLCLKTGVIEERRLLHIE